MSIKTVTTAQMRRLEVTAEKRYGLQPLILMENAGRSVASHVLSMKLLRNLEVVVLCGPGNNGGDAAVAARHLHLAGRSVEVFPYDISRRARQVSSNLSINLNVVKKMGLCKKVNVPASHLARRYKKNAFILDGLFGTGLTRDVMPPFSEIVDSVNHSHKMVYSIDVPSGIHSDTGVAMKHAISATFTGALGFTKKGLSLNAGRDAAGLITVLPIGLPTQRIGYEY